MHAPFITLASGSPRRRQLLKQAGYSFQVHPPDDAAEDGLRSNEAPEQLVCRLAMQKAENVARQFETGLFLGCDTVAVCDGAVLGKPSDREHARQILQAMSGRTHFVLSGVCLWSRPDDRGIVAFDSTTLHMQHWTDNTLKSYLDSGDWEGKAGAFGYQDGIDWVTILEGSESNVVGLPLELLESLMEQVARKDALQPLPDPTLA